MKQQSPLRCPFASQGRALIPPLLSNRTALPAKTAENQIAGIEKRLLAVVPRPHPALVPRRRLPLPFLAIPDHPVYHVPDIYRQPLSHQKPKWQDAVVSVARRRKVQDPSLPWPVDVEAAQLPDSMAMVMGSLQDQLGGTPVNPMSQRVTLSQLAREFFNLPENNWLTDATPMAFDTWVARFSPNRQQQLLAAREMVSLHGLESKDAIMAVFTKTETSSRATDPRNISPRSDRFLSVLGPHVARIEQLAKDCPYLVKGLTPQQRGARISASRLSQATETDFSRFDMTVSRDIIETVEEQMFRKVYPRGEYPDFDAALRCLSFLEGASSLGVRYAIEGTRASGDAHTSISNGIINRFVIWACLRHLPTDSWNSFHEGDDGVIHSTDDVTEPLRKALTFAGLLGFKLTVVIPDTPDHVNFCGRYTCPGCHREYCDLERTLTKFHTTYRPGEAKSLMLAKALSYFSTDSHTPVVGPLCHALIKHLAPKVSDRLLRRRLAELHWFDRAKVVAGLAVDESVVQDCCRVSLARVTNWTIDLQKAVEDDCRSWEHGIPHRSPVVVDDYLVDGPSHVVY